MTTNYRRTADWLAACGKEPSPQTMSVQLGCLIEEFVELMHSFNWTLKAGQIAIDSHALRVFGDSLREVALLANVLKGGGIVAESADREETLDALCDLEVTLNGVAYLSSFNKDEADLAVLASNEAKLVNGKPVLLAGGKIGKPEGWKPPDLSGCV